MSTNARRDIPDLLDINREPDRFWGVENLIVGVGSRRGRSRKLGSWGGSESGRGAVPSRAPPYGRAWLYSIEHSGKINTLPF